MALQKIWFMGVSNAIYAYNLYFCPKLGETLTFQPERVDYQGYLPFKKFPKVGQKRELIYRYLDGICKNDGNEKPCRTEHFSVK